MPGDVRLTQLARIFAIPADRATETAVQAAVSSKPADLGSAIFYEAVDSDDVVDETSARAYLDARLTILADLIPADTVAPIRAEFDRLVGAWQ